MQHESDRGHPGGALAGRHDGRRQRDLELRRKGRHVRSHGIVEFEWVFDAFDRAQGQLRDIRGIFRPQCRIAAHRFADDLTQIVADGQLREPKDLAQHDQVGGMDFLVRDGSVEPRAKRLQGLARSWVTAVRIDPNLIQAVRQTGKYFVSGFVPFLRVVQVEKILERGFELVDGGNLPPRHRTALAERFQQLLDEFPGQFRHLDARLGLRRAGFRFARTFNHGRLLFSATALSQIDPSAQTITARRDAPTSAKRLFDELAAAQLAHRLADFGLRVHYDRSVPGHRLANGFP